MYSEKVPAGARIVLCIVSVLLCIALFFAVVSAVLIADVRIVTSKDGLQTIISQALFAAPRPALQSAPLAGGIVARAADASASNQAQDAIVDALYGMLQEQFGDELPVSLEAVDELVHNSSLPDFVSEKVAGIINDIYTGKSTTTITKDEVVGLITENKALIENALNVTLDDALIDSIGAWVEESEVMTTVQQQVAEITGMEVPGMETNKDASETSFVPQLLETLRSITSVSALIGCIAVCLLLMGLLVLTHWGRPFAAMRTAGIPIMLAGLPFAGFTVNAGMFSLLVPGMGGKVLGAILSVTGYVGILVFLFGLALIIAGAILNSHFRKLYRAKLAAAAAVVEEAPAAAEEAPAEEVKEEAPAAE